MMNFEKPCFYLFIFTNIIKLTFDFRNLSIFVPKFFEICEMVMCQKWEELKPCPKKEIVDSKKERKEQAPSEVSSSYLRPGFTLL